MTRADILAPMNRIGLVPLAFAICTAAQAQPAPRTALDVSLPAGDGFQFDRWFSGGRLAIGKDGTHYVLSYEVNPLAGARATVSDARIDLRALAPDGAVKHQRTLPVRQGIGHKYFSLNATGVVVARSGDLAVFVSATDPAMMKAGRFTDATLFRLAADLRVKKTSDIGPPDAASRKAAESFYGPEIYLPTRDNAIMLGGGYGPGPHVWWVGKYSLDGARFWQDAGRGIPETTAAIAQRPDGSWLAVVKEMARSPTGLDVSARRYTIDGKLLARTRLAQISPDAVAVILRDGIAFITSADRAARRSELIVVGDHGRTLRRAPWPFAATLSAIEDGDGIAAIVAEPGSDPAPRYVVRADAQGVVRWRSAAIDATQIVRTPDGQVAVLADAGTERKSLRLVRYADP